MFFNSSTKVTNQISKTKTKAIKLEKYLNCLTYLFSSIIQIFSTQIMEIFRTCLGLFSFCVCYFAFITIKGVDLCKEF